MTKQGLGEKTAVGSEVSWISILEYRGGAIYLKEEVVNSINEVEKGRREERKEGGRRERGKEGR